MAQHIIGLLDKAEKQHQVQVNDYPSVCPICHTSVHPIFVAGICQSGPRDKPQAVFRCTTQNCGRLFIADYKFDGTDIHKLGKVEPVYPKTQALPNPVSKLSPVFVEVYNQSFAAEANNLHQLTGIGLRKALEFLVKDFSISLHPDQKTAIEQTLLAKCIEDFIEDDRIKTCAKLATWLGNDETHYVRKWQDKDISDLKLLIRLTVNWIENHLLTEQYKKDMMPAGTKPTC